MIKKSSLLLAAGILSLSSTTPLVAVASEVTHSPQTKSTSSTPSKPLPSTLPPASSSKGSEPQTSEPASRPKSSSTSSKENVASSQPAGTTTQQQKKSTAQAQQSTYSNLTDIASGTNGTVAWNIDAAGTLHLRAGTLRSNQGNFASPWDQYKSSIKKISFDGAVVASTNCNNLFSKFTNLTEISGLQYFNTSNVSDMARMFYGCSSLTNLDLSNWDTSNLQDTTFMFYGCSGLTSLDLSKFNTASVTGMSGMFYGCSGLTSLDLSKFNTAAVTNMSSMFGVCRGLTSLDLSNFDTASVTDMGAMFSSCSGLTSVDLSKFNTAAVTNMSSMFADCSGLTSLNISNFNTSSVGNMAKMFSGCSGLTSLDLSKFNTAAVTNMSNMFSGCRGLTSLDLSKFNTAAVTNMSNMFSGCRGLTSLDLSNFDTSKVTTMTSIFRSAPLGKISLGLKTGLKNDADLDSVPTNANYTGKWQTIGTGTQESPNGNWAGDTAALLIRSGTGVADTYVWQPTVPAADVTVKYVDTAGNTIHDPQTISGNVGEAYDATTATYKLVIDGYTLDSSQLPTNGTGTLSATAQTVTYVYTKNPVPAADVTVKYVDTAGNSIHASQTISGNVGDAYDATTATYKLAIDGYTLDASQLPTNGTGTLSATAQTVTYVYTKNPAPVKAADVTVKYVDTDGKSIHDPQTISGNVGDNYDATTATYKLAIDGYTLDASQLPANGTGTLSATVQTVTYVYTKNPAPVKAADVTVKYVDTDGKSIHASQTISGNVGEAYDTTKPNYKLVIDGYTLDASQLPTNAIGTLSATVQTVTYVYIKNKTNPPALPPHQSNPPRHSSSPQASSVDHRISKVTNGMKKLPHTGDNKFLSFLDIVIGIVTLSCALLFIMYKYMEKKHE